MREQQRGTVSSNSRFQTVVVVVAVVVVVVVVVVLLVVVVVFPRYSANLSLARPPQAPSSSGVSGMPRTGSFLEESTQKCVYVIMYIYIYIYIYIHTHTYVQGCRGPARSWRRCTLSGRRCTLFGGDVHCLEGDVHCLEGDAADRLVPGGEHTPSSYHQNSLLSGPETGKLKWVTRKADGNLTLLVNLGGS